jgi:hypothetical protein
MRLEASHRNQGHARPLEPTFTFFCRCNVDSVGQAGNQDENKLHCVYVGLCVKESRRRLCAAKTMMGQVQSLKSFV